MAPRQADVIPFPNEETTPPVIKTYDVMYESEVYGAWPIAASEKQERVGAKALRGMRCAFFQPFEFRAVVGLKTVLNVNRYTPVTQRLNALRPRSVQGWAILPAHRYARLADSPGRQPQIADGNEFITCVNQRQPIAHPGHHAFLLK